MRKRAQVLLPLLAIAFLGALYVFGIRNPAGDPVAADPASDTDRSAAHGEGKAGLAVEATDDAARAARQSAIPGGPDPSISEAEPGSSADLAAWLKVHLVQEVNRAPLEGVRVEAFGVGRSASELPQKVDVAAGSLRESPRSGADGTVEFELPAEVGISLVSMRESGESANTWTSVPPLRPGEHREVTVAMPTGDDFHLLGRVVAEEGGAPVVRANVSVVSSQSSGKLGVVPQWKSATLASTTTGPNGEFDLRLASWKHPHLRVEAAGFGLALFDPARGQDGKEREVVVELRRSASLQARLLDGAGGALTDAKILLQASGRSLDLVNEVGFFGIAAEIPDAVWQSRVDAEGKCELLDLPARTNLAVRIFSPGGVPFLDPSPIVLEPGQVLEREWRIQRGCRLDGLAIDQDGKPVPDLEIWLLRDNGESSSYLQPWDDDLVALTTRSDPEGRFRMESVPPGRWSLSPARDFHFDDRSRSVASFSQTVEVPASVSHTIELRVFRGLFVRGRVLDPEGKPAGAVLTASSGTQGALARSPSSEDGSFVLGPLAPGEVRVVAESNEELEAPSEPVAARAGDEGVIVRLRSGGVLRGRVVDSTSAQACQSAILISRQPFDPPASDWGVNFSSDAAGEFAMANLVPGRYGIAASTRDGRVGVLPGLEVSARGKIDGIEIPVSPGEKLLVRYDGKQGPAHVTPLARGVRLDWEQDIESGHAGEFLVPRGSVELVIRFEGGAKSVRRNLDVVPGGANELRVGDED